MSRAPFTASDAKRFYDRFGKRQDLQFYENAALERLLALGQFNRARAVFELGCGTGRLAQRLLFEQLPQGSRYVGVDVSETMVRLSRQRLARWRERAEVRQSDGAMRWPDADSAFDRFVATYVLDLLEEPDLVAVFREAHRLLAPGGLLCVVAMTDGQTALSRSLCAVWKAIHAWNPRLVGGCRPIRVGTFLDDAAWNQLDGEVVSSWGVCSEVAIAARI
ncbi:MAG TPA: class I SAM-dependent methyltransferase [Polyangiaceae bacterium]